MPLTHAHMLHHQMILSQPSKKKSDPTHQLFIVYYQKALCSSFSVHLNSSETASGEGVASMHVSSTEGGVA